MKKIISAILTLGILLTLLGCTPDDEKVIECQDDTLQEDNVMDTCDPLDTYPPTYRKPVIYLYPEEDTKVTVQLDFNGNLIHTYPLYNNGWTVTASPDGTLTDEFGREYYCLFWEGEADAEYDMSRGFVVPGRDIAEFLEDALFKLGLTDKEANEFIIYWAPQMENNRYNIISFQTTAYTDNAKLNVSPTPDTLIRIFMTWKGIDAPIEIEPQELTAPDRIGFTLVEWGGAEIK